MEAQQKLKEAFVRYLENRYTAQDLRLIQDHFQQETDREILSRLIAEEFEHTPTTHNKRIDQILDHSDAFITAELKKRKTAQNGWLYRKLVFRIAAAAILLLGIGLTYFLLQPAQPQLLTVSVPYGKRMEVQLPDSSKVWLNSGSTIQYPSKFSSADRTVLLKEGEAFFEVTHDAHKPFIIHSGSVDVSVLGTSFEISAFAKDKETKVTVSTGKVGVLQPTINRHANFLLPGEREIIDRITHQIQTVKVDPSDIAAWRTQQLIFQDEPLLSVLHTLERTYNVHFEIKNKRLIQERITTRFKNQTIDNVLTALSFSNHFTYTKANDQLIIVN